MNAVKEKTEVTPKAPAAATPETKGTPAVAPTAPWVTGPFAQLESFANDMERVFEEFGLGGRTFAPALFRRGRRLMGRGFEGMNAPALWMPRIEVSQKDNAYVVSADLPGLTKDDIKVEVSEGMLTIQGERKQTTEKTEKGYHMSECSYGSFYRDIPVPEGADVHKAEVIFKNGVLTVTIPATAPKVASRKLEVKEVH